jgi:hypothetical protein
MIKANLVKVSGKSFLPLKTLYIYIHGLTDRIFNTATKQQKLFYLRVLLSTCFWVIFPFLTYPKKSLILFYVKLNEKSVKHCIYADKSSDRIFPTTSNQHCNINLWDSMSKPVIVFARNPIYIYTNPQIEYSNILSVICTCKLRNFRFWRFPEVLDNILSARYLVYIILN